MGAWGSGPLDNDTASDWLDGTLWVPVEKELFALGIMGSKTPDYDDVDQVMQARAVIDVITRFPDKFFDVDALYGCKAYLLELLTGGPQAEFFAGWRDPEEVYEAVREQLREVDDMLETQGEPPESGELHN